MQTRLFIWLSLAAALAIALTALGVAANVTTMTAQAAPKLLRRCENNYSQDEIDEMIANGEDGYEPDDCALLAPTLTGPMLHNFCQPGDEDWVKFTARANTIYQLRAAAPSNYPTEPHLDLIDDGTVVAQNDHYFGSDAEIWWWNAGAERTVYVRVTELRGRAECGNSEYTLSLKAFKDKP
jgi:hypothetical protein